MRSFIDDWNNPYLFLENKPGEYMYEKSSLGKSATGFLKIAEDPQRDGKAQSRAGHEYRRRRDNSYGVDDGGHLIGARFGGSPGDENLTAQDRNVNRSQYKQIEDEWATWAKHVEDGYKVFVHIETDHPERPNDYMGYVIGENPNGKRFYETFSLLNENKEWQSQWEKEVAALEDHSYAFDSEELIQDEEHFMDSNNILATMDEVEYDDGHLLPDIDAEIMTESENKENEIDM